MAPAARWVLGITQLRRAPPRERRAGARMSDAETKEVWFEFLNHDETAIPRTWSALTSGRDAPAGVANADRVVFRRGKVDEWTPLGEVTERMGTLEPIPSERGSQTSMRRASVKSDESSASADNVQQGVSVRYDPVTGGAPQTPHHHHHPAGIHTVAPHAGLTGLPEGWSGILPDGCAPDTVSAGSGLPPELVPSTRASPGVRLKDEAIVGKPFNVQRWRPAFGIPLEHVETSERNGFEIPLVLCTLRDGLRRMGGLHEEGIFRLAPDAALCQSACEALNANAAVVPKVCSLVRRPRLS